MNYTQSVTIRAKRQDEAVAKPRALRVSDRVFHRSVIALTSTSLLAGAVVVGYAAYRLIAS